LDNLRFGTTARRKAQRRRRTRRIVLTLWTLSVIGLIAGVPLARTTAIDLIERFVVEDADAQSARSSVAGSLEVEGEPPEHPAPEVTLGHDGKKKLPDLVAERRKERRKAAASESGSSGLEAAYASGDIVEIIHAAGAEFGVDGDYLVSIAECESGLDPQAYNSAGYHGLFQYDDTTWSAYGEGSIWDPVAQARATAELIAAGQSSRWPNCA
jgi:hypothetical protein